jgi:hypothetical protein
MNCAGFCADQLGAGIQNRTGSTIVAMPHALYCRLNFLAILNN